MAVTNQGRIGYIPKGEYNAETTYKKLDCVIYNGNTYAALKETKGVAPTVATNWQILVDNSDGTQALEAAMNAVNKANQQADEIPQDIATEIAKLTDENADMAEVIQARTTADGKTYVTLKARLDAQYAELRGDIDHPGYNSRTHIYGILWDKQNATCTRLYDAVGKTAAAHKGAYNSSMTNDFDSLYPWSQRKLCNVDIAEYQTLKTNEGNIEEAITAWEGDPDFSYTGENGAVMVYTPEFWMMTQNTDDGIIVAIADKKVDGWIEVPRYIGGRYFASDDGDGSVTSVAGVIPLTVTAMSTLHSKAKTKKMTIDDLWTWTADTALLCVEFATLNTQTAIGDGVSNLYRQSGEKAFVSETGATRVIAPNALANVAVPGAILDIGTSDGGIQVGRRIVTSIEAYPNNASYKIVNFAGAALDITTDHYISIHGLSNVADEQIGSASGYIGTNGKANAYYRGRVAHGNMWRYVLGAYRQTGTGHIWVAHNRDEADAYDGINTNVHIDTGFKLPQAANGTDATSGYLNELFFSSDFPLAPFGKSVGGDSSKPVGDYIYVPAQSTTNTILLCGASASYGAYVGRFFGSWNAASGSASWGFAALPFLK